jgi:cystathionine beta-lyase
MMVACSDETRAVLAQLPAETPYHAGHLGVIAACAAFREGDSWLTGAIAILDRNRRRLAELLGASLPGVRYVPPAAGYLAWLDCAALGLGDDPARAFLERGRVALSSGPTFGAEGVGFARLNIATTRDLLEEAVRRVSVGAQ